MTSIDLHTYCTVLRNIKCVGYVSAATMHNHIKDIGIYSKSCLGDEIISNYAITEFGKFLNWLVSGK